MLECPCMYVQWILGRTYRQHHLTSRRAMASFDVKESYGIIWRQRELLRGTIEGFALSSKPSSLLRSSRSDHRVVLCWLVMCTIICESDSSIQMNAIFVIWLQPTFCRHQWTSALMIKVFRRNQPVFRSLLYDKAWRPVLGLFLLILIVTFWLVEAVRILAARNSPYIAVNARQHRSNKFMEFVIKSSKSSETLQVHNVQIDLLIDKHTDTLPPTHIPETTDSPPSQHT